MRICYIANGKYVHTYRWIRFFADKGYSVHLVSYAPLEATDVAAVRNAGGVYHGDLDGFHLKRFWRTARSLHLLRSVLKRERIDVLHSHFLGANSWYAALSRFRPLVVTVMGGDVTGPEWRPSDDVRERFLTPHTLRRADLVTCWSDRLTSIIKHYTKPGTPIEVVHGGVDLARFAPGPRPRYLLERWHLPEDAHVILSPRMMRPIYNILEIAKAAEQICAADPKAYFLFAYASVATDWEYEAQVRATIEDAGLTDRIRFLGEIPHEEMGDHYRLADVVVSVPRTDGTPMTVLEAMACGTPIVVSRIPDYDPHYIEADRTVLAVSLDVSGELSRAVLRLLREGNVATQLTEEARRRVVEYGAYEAQMSKMDRLYQSLVDRR